MCNKLCHQLCKLGMGDWIHSFLSPLNFCEQRLASAVRRYFWLRLRGLFWRVISIHPPFSEGWMYSLIKCMRSFIWCKLSNARRVSSPSGRQACWTERLHISGVRLVPFHNWHWVFHQNGSTLPWSKTCGSHCAPSAVRLHLREWKYVRFKTIFHMCILRFRSSCHWVLRCRPGQRSYVFFPQ